jgi:murein DD-endopeptidase MepM/ murein hydrolase activator NlpD
VRLTRVKLCLLANAGYRIDLETLRSDFSVVPILAWAGWPLDAAPNCLRELFRTEATVSRGQVAVRSLLKQFFAAGGTTGARFAGGRGRAGAPLIGCAVLLVAAAAVSSSRPDARLQAAALSMPIAALPSAGASPRIQSSKQQEEPSLRRFRGLVGPNLSEALQAVGVPEQQGREYVSLLARAIPLANGLSVDDRFDLVIERRPNGSLGRLLYAGMDRVARADVQLLKWTDGKSVIWVNADGVGGGERSETMRMPVSGRVSSPFGERFHPILGYARMHQGVDLAAAAGTPIVAAANGRVTSAGWRGGYGRAVSIAHGEGIQTTYGHMSRIAAYPGETVRRGQIIGYVGSSGLSTGPHLHFQVTRNGRAVNPLSVKMGSGPDRLEGAKLAQFHSELRQLLLVPEQVDTKNLALKFH